MRLALALPAVVAALLLLPAAASAQAPPPDERAAAQAFADAAKRFGAAIDALGDEPDTTWLDPCKRAFERVRMGRGLDAAPAPGNFCAELRTWRRAGYPRSAVRKAEAALRETLSAFSPGILRKVEATATRLRELGVPRNDAKEFGGNGGW